MQAQWFRLDNAALIFPAIMRRNWSNAFRLSATLTEPVDTALLRQAALALRPRFPTFFVRLRAGLFWFRLERTDEPVQIEEDYAYPLTHMPSAYLRRGRLFVIAGLFLSLGGVCMLIELFAHITFRSAMFLWSLYCVVFFSALGIFLLIAAIVPALRQYLARKFFI